MIRFLLCFCLLILGLQQAALAQPGEETGTFLIRKYRCISSREKARVDANKSEANIEVLRAITGLVYSEGDSILDIAAETTILFYRKDTLAAYAVSDSLGQFTASLSLGTYRIETCKRRFLSHTDSIEISEFQPSKLRHDLYITPLVEVTTDTLGTSPLAVATSTVDLVPGTTPERNPTTPLSKGSLVGQITLTENDFPLENIKVSIYLDDVFVRSTSCDEEGIYRFRTLDDGDYKVIVTTNRTYNEPISGVAVRRGKIKFLDLTFSKRGKIKKR